MLGKSERPFSAHHGLLSHHSPLVLLRGPEAGPTPFCVCRWGYQACSTEDTTVMSKETAAGRRFPFWFQSSLVIITHLGAPQPP